MDSGRRASRAAWCGANFAVPAAADLGGIVHSEFPQRPGIDPGFNPHQVLIASYDLFTAGYSDSSGAEFDRQLVRKLEALPGVESVALSNRVPLGFGGGSTSVKPQGYVPQANESMETQVAFITPNYFHTMQIPMVEGATSPSRTRRVPSARRSSAKLL